MRRRSLVRSTAVALVALGLAACASSSEGESGTAARTNIPVVGGDGGSTRDRSPGTTAASRASGGAATTAAGAATTAAAASGARPSPTAPPREADGAPPDNPAVRTADDNRSTFALDVDTASYSLARDALNKGRLPDRDSVRTEEFVNSFDQGFPTATERGLTLRADGARVPFLDASHRVVRVAVQGQTVGERKRANLTFVVDTSGSMSYEGKLELVKVGLRQLASSLNADDTVEIVTFASRAAVALERTRVGERGARDRIDAAIDELRTSDSTNLEAGMALGYRGARDAFDRAAINRVVLATDGVANTGATTANAILAQVREDAGDGIQLAAIGVGFGTYNDALLERLADDGNGFYVYVDDAAQAERLFGERLTTTFQTVARDGKAEVRFNPSVVRSYRLLGYEDRAIPDGTLTNPDVDGGETGSGHVTTALYDVELRTSDVAGTDLVATAWVHWTDPDITTGRDRTLDITVGDVSRDFGDAPARLRLDVWVAAFAEELRGSPWSDRVDYDTVASGLRAVRGLVDDDPAVIELLDLVGLAERAG